MKFSNVRVDFGIFLTEKNHCQNFVLYKYKKISIKEFISFRIKDFKKV